MKLDFVAIDVETANEDYSSICQIGLVKYVDGKLVEVWESLINPEDAFDPINIGIHKITEADVTMSPTFPEIVDKLHSFMNGVVCVSYGSFDKSAINQALNEHGFPEFDVTWLDSMKVVRRAWPKFARRGYGLANVTRELGHSFNHHNALEDAKACAYVLLAAIEETGLDIEGWLERVGQPIKRK